MFKANWNVSVRIQEWKSKNHPGYTYRIADKYLLPILLIPNNKPQNNVKKSTNNFPCPIRAGLLDCQE